MTDTEAPAAARPDVRFVALLLLGALAVRVAGLGRDDFWSDEVHTAAALARDSGGIMQERLAAGHFPLYFLLLEAWSSFAGTSQFALRLPAALFGAASVWPLYGLLRRVIDPRSARWGAALFAFHPVLLELSREARMYSLLVLCFVVVAEAAVAAFDEGRVPWRFWAAAVIGALVHPTWGFGLLALAAWVALERRRADGAARGAAGRMLAGLVLSAAVLVAGLVLATPQHHELVRRPWPREVGVFALRLVSGAGVTQTFTVLYVLLLAAWTWAVADGWSVASPRARTLAVALLLGVPAASIVAGVLFGVPFGPMRYVAVTSVGLAVLGGAGLGRQGGRAWVLAVLVAAACGVRFVPPHTRLSALAGELAQVAAPGDVVRAPDAATATVLSHYLGGRRVYAKYVPEDTDGYWCAGCRKPMAHWLQRGIDDEAE